MSDFYFIKLIIQSKNDIFDWNFIDFYLPLEYEDKQDFLDSLIKKYI